MKVTVGSFARRLGMLFLSETASAQVPTQRSSKPANLNVEEEEVTEHGEQGSSEPLLTPQPTPSKYSDAPTVPLQQPYGDTGAVLTLSPFVILGEAQVEIEAEEDLTLEEAEEARESPLHKRLSMSLITCHEEDVSSQIFAEVHHDRPLSPLPNVDVQVLQEGPDHSYALLSIVSEPESPQSADEPAIRTADVIVVTATPEQTEEDVAVLVETKPNPPAVQESLKLQSAEGPTPQANSVPSPGLTQQLQPTTGIRCPTFDSKSPSQVVFKPQWLGKGFGATGLRARGVQGRGSKGGSSPLSVRVAVKSVSNENKGQSAKQKQKGNGLGEGRSPLQILKATNSPRDKPSPMKVKVATPERQRLGQMDRRILAVSLDKENR
ncbi:cell division cycle-associated protein 3 [Aplochiton taeniatus]